MQRQQSQEKTKKVNLNKLWQKNHPIQLLLWKHHPGMQCTNQSNTFKHTFLENDSKTLCECNYSSSRDGG